LSVLMRIAVPKETAPGERRVALVPESCKKLIAAGYEISIEPGAGDAAGYADDEYREAGVAVQTDSASLLGAADLVLKVTTPSAGPAREEVGWMRPWTIYLGSLMPLRNLGVVRALADRKITKARTVIAIKRSKSPGFAGIENELYFTDHTWMLFGDAKEVVGELVKQLAADAGARAQAA
jgi:NAD/NADP transhydrogenase alpha subunit